MNTQYIPLHFTVDLDDLNYRLYGLYNKYGLWQEFRMQVNNLLDTEFKDVVGANEVVLNFINIKAHELREQSDKINQRLFNPLIKDVLKEKLNTLVKEDKNGNSK